MCIHVYRRSLIEPLLTAWGGLPVFSPSRLHDNHHTWYSLKHLAPQQHHRSFNSKQFRNAQKHVLLRRHRVRTQFDCSRAGSKSVTTCRRGFLPRNIAFANMRLKKLLKFSTSGPTEHAHVFPPKPLDPSSQVQKNNANVKETFTTLILPMMNTNPPRRRKGRCLVAKVKRSSLQTCN